MIFLLPFILYSLSSFALTFSRSRLLSLCAHKILHAAKSMKNTLLASHWRHKNNDQSERIVVCGHSWMEQKKAKNHLKLLVRFALCLILYSCFTVFGLMKCGHDYNKVAAAAAAASVDKLLFYIKIERWTIGIITSCNFLPNDSLTHKDAAHFFDANKFNFLSKAIKRVCSRLIEKERVSLSID